MKMRNKKIQNLSHGFTLAEVLITLVIIGIVAALTISAVINTYVERSTVAKVKKGLSILGQAKKLAEVQNGSIEGWNYGADVTSQTARDFWKYLKPHLSVAKDCGTNLDCYQTNGTWTLSGSTSGDYTDSKYYKFILGDGSIMLFRTDTGKCGGSDGTFNDVCAVFVYDVNGDKKPNTWGKDIFCYIMNTDGVYPRNHDDCRINADGYGCANYIINRGNMGYLH